MTKSVGERLAKSVRLLYSKIVDQRVVGIDGLRLRLSEIEFDYDVIVLGGGAAGLFAGSVAAEGGASTVVLEKNRRAGVKILMSGGTRCNLTNARGLRTLRGISGPIDPEYNPNQALGARSIQQAFGDGGAFLGPALKAFSVEETVAFFEGEGVAAKVEGNGKIFPASDKAIDVLDALLRRLKRSGCALRCHSAAIAIRAVVDGFEVELLGETLKTRRLIIAVGGQSYPGSGTTGDGYTFARGFGHTIREPKPALVPIRVVPEWVAGLKGLTLPDIVATIVDGDGRPLLERREALLFAHFGLTGPAILDVSRAVARHREETSLMLRLDLLPDSKTEAIDQELQAGCRSGRQLVVNLLPKAIPRRLGEALLATSGIPVERIGPDLSREERKRLVTNLKGLKLPVAGTLGFAKAEVTSGGVVLDEVDPKTLQSRLQPGLYFAGEVLDLDGLIGGYNFQGAWSTGKLAGESAARSALELRAGQRSGT